MVKSLLRSIARLWCHENTRVFADRLSDSRDHVWFVKLLDTCLKYCFCGMSLQAMAGGGGAARTARGGENSSIGTAAGRRARQARQRQVVAQTSRGGGAGGEDALSAELMESGIRVDILHKLLPQVRQEKLLDYEQVTVKGEDLSGLLFAQMPIQQEQVEGADNQQTGGSEEKVIQEKTQR